MFNKLVAALSGGITTNAWCETECPCGQYTRCIVTLTGFKVCECTNM